MSGHTAAQNIHKPLELLLFMNSFVLLSGCSGGGKSTLLAELERRGHTVIQEPGRRIVQDQLAKGGTALPWVDMDAFLHAAISVACSDYSHAVRDGQWVFFDRGVVDAASALQELTGKLVLKQMNNLYPYHRHVFLTPPWPEIYPSDPERRHDMDAAIKEYERLALVYSALGYQVNVLPKLSVPERADWVLDTLEKAQSQKKSV